MECNIDAKGRAARLIAGSIMVAVALIVFALWLTGVVSGWGWWAAAAAGAVLGAFGIFEGRAGWCVVRAMGFRTPW